MPPVTPSQIISAALSNRINNENALLIADENTHPQQIKALAEFKHISVMTNRFDIAESCKKNSLPYLLSDFDFSELENPNEISYFIYRISKEKPLCHHIINSIRQNISDKAELIIFGKKNEGIKSYHQNCLAQLKFQGALKKNNDYYIAHLLGAGKNSEAQYLDDQDYKTPRMVGANSDNTDSLPFISKPGQYGWDKIDKGSQLLLHLLQEEMSNQRKAFSRVIDLGCGYGFLSMGILSGQAALPNIERLVATDNNVAAVHCCKLNLAKMQNKATEATVILDDCAANISEKFDLLVCNPPFHVGFDTSKDITHKFLAASKRLLSKHGEAWFVVNNFIGLENIAKSYFSTCLTAHANSQFKIVILSN